MVTAKPRRRFPDGPRGYGDGVESRDVYQDDLTEERQPSPAQRDDVAKSETLDPDRSADGAEDAKE